MLLVSVGVILILIAVIIGGIQVLNIAKTYEAVGISAENRYYWYGFVGVIGLIASS
jgi:hypothetical protein